ncbi:MAG: biopolymer transporter ExbD [endosymbiont of Galathealinum brachiosum]|uniref:Biopolymer transporter ExbD n=1 Tax=endosymbiont of Galathealinum brachiosum TaxID=2200906 RepID=A0A370D8G1_9GAMM|nr:MAG: biopolymer transporter ExbD [endosymbiont of Galathealinum brachiosum]
MARKTRYRRTDKEVPEMDITTFLNLMVVLIPFLLITAVFSRVTILELNLPTSSGANAPSKIKLNIEVIVREKGLEIGNGRRVVARFPKVEDKYDFAKLSKHLLEIKKNYPDKTDATVLMEPDIQYELLVHVMDAVRLVELEQSESGIFEKVALFPDISIGDAP